MMMIMIKQNKTLADLVKELYQLKGRLREIPSYNDPVRKPLNARKDALILQIKTELRKVKKKAEADRIKKKLWDELGVML